MTRIALLQMTSGIDPLANAQAIASAAERAAGEGAAMLFTPEMALLLDRDRTRAADHVLPEGDNPAVAVVAKAASRHDLWITLGLPAMREDGRWVNRTLVFDKTGDVAARYDKIHMFDVALASGESWRESAAYAPGNDVVTAEATPVGRLGLTTCYDIRFPALFEELGRKSCDAIAIPAAFTVPTGTAHWHLLQRARAVEASAFVIAAAQVGHHADGRTTYGHSLVVDPWGEVLLDMGADNAGLGLCDVDLDRIAETRAQLPSLANRRVIPRSDVS
ncbi:carbon-nitrogen hydrolase family protein [Erythrobacter arachoides]|uniref:Carbon-nitrogen hydrolase family protein n=1 Tax=Aurantiacibacter arachoides TaxID=1850444 RepID=A0A845A0V7_9SPHN|nr:nitrilase-related carbon-nitrogen hydrolase [Aurantiacibacter arachoides]MXO93112.1 carbon-nitrogen hydrolase family protein [Aurantiacibacter arachoides]GGD51930.1 amidohydrolase [Aurantiacibacter arachoides]